MSLRERIRLLIAQSGLSLRQLAAQSGVRRQSLHRFLAGGNLHLKNLEKLLSALGYRLQPIAERPPADIQARLKQHLTIREKELARYCQRRGIRSLAFYGSVLRDDFNDASDIDVLIDPEKSLTLFDLIAIEKELQSLFHARQSIHVITYKGLSPLIAADVMNGAQVIYAKAA